METTTSGHELSFRLAVNNGKGPREIVDCCGLDKTPLIRVAIRKTDLACREYFEVLNDDGLLQSIGPIRRSDDGDIVWVYLSSKEVTITTLDEEGRIGYEFVLSLHQNGSHIEIKVSRSRFFGSARVSVEQLRQDLIQAAETSRKRRTHPTFKAVEDLIQALMLKSAVHASGDPIPVNHNGRGGKRILGGIFLDTYRQIKSEAPPAF